MYLIIAVTIAMYLIIAVTIAILQFPYVCGKIGRENVFTL